MKILILIILSFIRLFAQNELTSIEDSYKEASKSFIVQKDEHNITKLLAITKILYDNNKKLKELKAKYTKKLSVKLTSEKPLDKLQVEDIVELQVETSHNISDEYAKSDLNFFIYDRENLLATKDVELYEKGGIHKESLKFKITEPSDKYKICATFTENDKVYKECKSFGVVQLIVAKPIIASTSLEATSSDKQLFPNREFFLYMPFENKSDIPLKGKIEIADSGNVIFSKDFKKEPAIGFKKAGVQVPASLLHEKQSLHVKISLKGEGINPIEKEEDVYISAFEWSLYFPSSLDENEAKNFEIVAPKSFLKPLHVDVSPHGGIVVEHSSSKLKGSIVGASRIKETANVRITIKDAKGEKVQRSIAIALNPNLVVAKNEPVVYTPKPLKKHAQKKTQKYTPKPVTEYKPNVAPKPEKREVKKLYKFSSFQGDWYLKFKYNGEDYKFVFDSNKKLKALDVGGYRELYYSFDRDLYKNIWDNSLGEVGWDSIGKKLDEYSAAMQGLAYMAKKYPEIDTFGLKMQDAELGIKFLIFADQLGKYKKRLNSPIKDWASKPVIPNKFSEFIKSHSTNRNMFLNTPVNSRTSQYVVKKFQDWYCRKPASLLFEKMRKAFDKYCKKYNVKSHL
jgi:Holliday junction resolvase